MTLVSIYLAMIVYLTDGTPLPQMFILPPEAGCNHAVAVQYARTFVQPTVPPGYAMQDPEAKMRWMCLAVESETPGPAMSVRHIPQEDEA